MKTGDFDQAHAVIRDELNGLITWAAERGEFTTKRTTLETSGQIFISTHPTSWPLLLAEAVLRLAAIKADKQ